MKLDVHNILIRLGINWSGREDLNLRPPAPKAKKIVFQAYSSHFKTHQKILTLQWISP